ncbi:MAG: lipid-binding SYLF domain-containing protein [Burkholderiaceae bacterium]|jgi:lipid-binding SYLF domain-containing protein|nr:lipid-binding SYLF domain-containing protein [Burkholderiaceae bacterium]
MKDRNDPVPDPLRRMTLTLLGAAAIGLSAPSLAQADDAAEARALVDKARVSFDALMRAKEQDSLRDGIKRARGVLIFPSVLKGGFFLGGSGGTGVLLVRGERNEWSQPAFYTMGSVSFGVQFGGQAAEVVILVNSQAAVDRLLSSSLKLGGDASVAAGPVGAGQAANLQADFVSYARSKGAFIGMSVEGSVIDVRNSLNNGYYGKPVTPVEILVKGQVKNRQADPLRRTVAAAAK